MTPITYDWFSIARALSRLVQWLSRAAGQFAITIITWTPCRVATLKASGLPDADTVHAAHWHDCVKSFEEMHFLDGFGNHVAVWAHTNPRPMGKEPAVKHGEALITEHTPMLHPE